MAQSHLQVSCLSAAGVIVLAIAIQGAAPEMPAERKTIDVASGAWQSVSEPRGFEFPHDHAAHDDYKIEWWYYTGNLQAAAGRQFGYQLTFFRTGLLHSPRNPSRWSLRDLYVTHFAISDIAAEQFQFHERVARRGVGWAGAATDRYQVWNGQWSVREEEGKHLLNAADGPNKITLTLSSTKPPVLHGRQGLFQKDETGKNASYYYSLTRMETTGTMTVAGQTFTVTGQSWMDHEFCSSILGTDQAGWDWFALQLDDGSELMLYQMRRKDGELDRYSSGTLVHPDGTSEPISQSEFQLQPQRTWTSAASKTTYPIQWSVRIPSRHIDLIVLAAFPGQEMNTVASTGFPYWEGSVSVRGAKLGKPLAGRGYLELTGYQKSFAHAVGN